MDQLSTPVPTCSVKFALQQLGTARGELDDLQAALRFALRIGEHFAMLAADDGGEFGETRFKDLPKTKKNSRPAQMRLCRPFRKGGSG